MDALIEWKGIATDDADLMQCVSESGTDWDIKQLESFRIHRAKPITIEEGLNWWMYNDHA